MTDKRSYPAGVPCWVDTEQPDINAARRFYEGLFGWTFTDAMPPDAPGTYLIASLGGDGRGRDRAGRGGAGAEWNTYIAVEDADAAAASVCAAGGTLELGSGGRRARWPTGGLCRPSRGAVPAVAASPAVRRSARQRAGQLEFQRSAHRRPGSGR